MLTCKLGNISGELDISTISLEGRNIVKKFKSQMTLWDYAGRKVTINAKTGKKEYSKPEPLNIFFFMHKDKIYLPLEPLRLLCNNLDNAGIVITYSKIEEYTPDSIDITFKEGITLYDKQTACINKIEDSGLSTGLIGLDPGSGKAITNNTLVPTPDGFIRHGDLKVGSKVFASNGKTTEVLEVFPHPQKTVYVVEFSDYTTIECCREHLWTVIDAEVKNKGTGYVSRDLLTRTLTTEELLDIGIWTNKSTWVGDEGKATSRFSIPKHRGRREEFKNYKARLLSYTGFIEKHGTSFASSDKKMVDRFLKLARSLGFLYRAEEDVCGDLQVCWIVDVIREPRGKRIISIEKTDGKEDMTCIKIASADHMYMVSEAYTLTHNTFTALAYASKRKQRIMIFSKASYLVQWQREIAEVVKVGDATLITSTDSLLKLLEKAKSGDIPDVILLSLATYRSYVKRWLKGDERLHTSPMDLASTLKLGIAISDESHTELPALWALFSFTNVPLLLGLSGTMSSSDPFIKSIMRWMFPLESSYYENSTDGYIELIHYYYRLENPKSVVVSHRGRNTYSHVAFEKWMLRNKTLVNRYCNLVDDVFTKVFLNRRKPGDKCLIFVSMVSMADAVVKYLRSKHGDENLKMINFTGSVSKEDVLKVDVMVSTIGKSGTAMDHAGLTTLINTVAVFKKETAVQNIQRLRRPKNKPLDRYNDYMDDVQRVCVQFICTDISAHLYFTRNRLSAIRRVTSKVIDVDTAYFL